MNDSRFRQQSREQPEPQEGSRPVPKIVLTVIGLLLLWAVFHLYTSFNPMPADVGDDRVAADFAVPVHADGGQLYAANCVACHQANGKGAGPVKPLDGSAVVLDADHSDQMDVVLKGRMDKGMPSWKQLSDTDIAAVITYTKNSWSNKTGQLVQPAEVVAERAKINP